MANLNIQRLLADSCEIEVFNTSRGRPREDLYGKKNVNDIFLSLQLLVKYFLFIRKSKSTVVNVFATSNISFFRDIWFILWAKIFSKKIIVHLHSKQSGELFLSRFGLFVMAMIFKSADIIVVLSEEHKNYFASFFKKSRVEVLNNFVFVNDFSPKNNKRVREFLFVGRLTEEKGIYDLVDAVSVLKDKGIDLCVHLMGVAETDEKEAELISYIEEKMLENYFVFHGLLSGEKKFNLFKLCEFFVFPSHFENSPVVLKEAMAAKQIIVCSDIDANINVVKDFKSVLTFPVKNSTKLSKLMERLTCDSSLSAELAKSAHCPSYATDTNAKIKMMSLINGIESKL